MSKLYDTDFAAWARDTAQLLRERRFEEIDLDALIEEVEGLARADEHAIRSYLERLIEPLLKLTYASAADFDRDQRGLGTPASAFKYGTSIRVLAPR